MAITPGNKFEYNDLAPLLAQANSLSSSNYDLSGFYDVSPMNLDLNNNPYGYRLCGSFSVTARGTGYAVGDVLASPGYTTQFEVAAVDANGAIIGLLIQSNSPFAPSGDTTTTPAWPALNDPTPGALTNVTSKGTGATVTFVVVQVGPSQPYSMPDYLPGKGYFTGFFIVAGGSGYSVGDNLTVPAAVVTSGALPVTVTAVDGNGAITGFALPDASYKVWQFQVPAQPMAVTGGSGSGATLGGLFIMLQRPQWLAELNRLRNNIWNIPGFGGAQGFIDGTSPAALCVSGPWPVGGITANFKDTWFYYADTGKQEKVTLTSTFWPSSTGPFGTATAYMTYSTDEGDPLDPTFIGLYANHFELSFVIGGNAPIAVNGVFYITGIVYTGQTVHITVVNGVETVNTTTPDGTTPASMLTINGNMPGTLAVLVGGSPDTNTYVTITFSVNESLAPGRYTAIVDVAVPATDTTVFTTPADQTFDAVVTTHTRLQFMGVGQTQPYLAAVASYVLNPAYNNSFTPAGSATASFTYATSVQTPGIHNSKNILKINLPGDEIFSGAGIGTVSRFALSYGGTWGPNTNYELGAEVIDYNGNTQQVIFRTGAYSGPAAPQWGTTVGSTTVEGGMTWQCVALAAVPIPNWQYPPYPQPVMGAEKVVISELAESTSTPGFWTASCNAVTSLNIATEQMMPWNQIRTKYGQAGNARVNPMLLGDLAPTPNSGPLANQAQVSGSYNNSLPVEQQLEPPLWKANTFFPPNFTILDPNGNTQISGNGATSGTTPPAFATTKGGFTYDGGPVGPGTLVWHCIYVPAKSIRPAQHRIPNLPRYPFYWLNETIARLKPPVSGGGLTVWGAYSQWKLNFYFGSNYDPGWQQRYPASRGAPADTGGMAYGWWIYSVSINRIVENAPPISVTIGCMRNGTFAAFGTYATGQTVKVLWPVFTSDALVYQASERVDIQALAIASSNSVATGATVVSPVCAAFIMDTVALLGLV